MSAELSEERKIRDFCVAQWGDKPMSWIGLKLGEEAGEVAGAIVRLDEKRGTLDDLDKEIGDVLIVLSQLASMRGLTLAQLRDWRFDQIQARAVQRRILEQ
jgi:NTP pyrophosphatase (non-canonical NTP hydrolase)